MEWVNPHGSRSPDTAQHGNYTANGRSLTLKD
jgi:hypothetical protein